MKSNVAAIVVTHNNEDTISACISGLHKNGVRDIIIIDNASSDSTAEQVEKLPVRLMKNEQNKGFGPAVNQGFYSLSSTSSLVLFINPDAFLRPGSLSEAAAYMEGSPRVGIAGLLLCDEVGNPELHSFGDKPTLWSLFRRKISSGQMPRVTSQVCETAWVSGGAMLIRRELFRELHGFDEGFFMYWEDVDLCTRARQRSWEVVLLPAARALHQRGASMADRRRKALWYDQSADRYFRKHYATPIWLTHRYLRRIYRFFFPQAL